MANTLLEKYKEQAERLWKRVPAFNILQLRWLQNMLEVYRNDLQEISLQLAANPKNEDLQGRLTRAAAHVELLTYQIDMIEKHVK